MLNKKIILLQRESKNSNVFNNVGVLNIGGEEGILFKNKNIKTCGVMLFKNHLIFMDESRSCKNCVIYFDSIAEVSPYVYPKTDIPICEGDTIKTNIDNKKGITGLIIYSKDNRSWSIETYYNGKPNIDLVFNEALPEILIKTGSIYKEI